MPPVKKPKRTKKRPSRKVSEAKVSEHGQWIIKAGKLVPSRGRPEAINSLFKVVAEKIPFECLSNIEKDMRTKKLPRSGIYCAHDSVGAVRYVGRGSIFSRLRTRKNMHPLELLYFSFYVIPDSKHEREIETLLIRATSHLLDFNEKKRRPTIEIGNVRDYEGGTFFYERQKKKGKKN